MGSACVGSGFISSGLISSEFIDSGFMSSELIHMIIHSVTDLGLTNVGPFFIFEKL